MNYLRPGDALLVVDVQNDFLPGGPLAVPEGQEIIPALQRYLDVFAEASAPVFATRDWHPPNHCSFHAQGGPWPAHCVARTHGAEFPPSALAALVHRHLKRRRRTRKPIPGFQGTSLRSSPGRRHRPPL
ncbi:MAG: isochorismatase family protein [Nitrospira sp.]|nr:isochorismatase family protein [Nitrospira sp.]